MPRQTQCPGCGRRIVGRDGTLDMLSDAERESADRFAVQYVALRIREGWAAPDGREDPAGGKPHLWKRRTESVLQAARELALLDRSAGRPVVIDMGSGGGWAARLLIDLDVIAIDLIERANRVALGVRADMRRLPLSNGSVDGLLFAASLHYAPVTDVVPEAARVLRAGGLMIVVDSPIYRDKAAQARARARSESYYAAAGFPELAGWYHPISGAELKAVLVASGLRPLRFEVGHPSGTLWRRLTHRPPTAFVLAAKVA